MLPALRRDISFVAYEIQVGRLFNNMNVFLKRE